MADTVTSKTLIDGKRHHVIRLTNISDGTGESDVVKVDRSTLTGPDGVTIPVMLAVEELTYSIQGFEGVQLYWEEAGGDETIAVLAGEGYYDFRPYGALYPSQDPGIAADGDIKLSTIGTAAANDTYDLLIVFRKGD